MHAILGLFFMVGLLVISYFLCRIGGGDSSEGVDRNGHRP